MHVLIDCTNYEVIATHEHARALCAIAYIQYANVDTVVMPCDENRPFAQFTAEELDKLYRNVISRVDYVLKTEPYCDTIARTRKVIEAATHLRLPFDVEFLEQQAACIDETDDRPYRISADRSIAKPTKAKSWANEPQRNRPRGKPPGKPTARQLTENTGAPVAPSPPRLPQPPAARAAIPQPPKGGLPLPPKPPTPDAITTHKGVPVAVEHKTVPAKPKPTAPKTPRSSTKDRPTQNGVTRPAPGSKTVVPWEVADRLWSEGQRDIKALRKLVVAECVKQGVNSSTAGTQYGHWVTFNKK